MTRFRRRLVVLLIALVALPGLGYLAYPHIEIAPFRHDILGIDVSDHSGDIDWTALARDRVAFAYIKATEGGDYVDVNFRKNWEGAKAAGLRFGAYHFYRLCKPGAEQAANFIANVPKDPEALAPVIDAQYFSTCTPPVNLVPADEIAAFLAAVEAHFGCRPIIYTTAKFERAYLAGALPNETFWLRSLFLPPSFRAETWKIWHYHNRGRRNGAPLPLDLSAFRGSAADFTDPQKGLVCAAKANP